MVTGCIVISRVISGNIAFGKGFIFVSVSIIIGILRFISIYFVSNFYFSITEVWSGAPSRCGGAGRQDPVLPCPDTAENGEGFHPHHEEEGREADLGGWWPF